MRCIVSVGVVLALLAVVATQAMAQDVRSSAMGEAGVGLGDGPDAIGYNPAGLPWVTAAQDGSSGVGWVGAASGLASLDVDSGAEGEDPSRVGLFYAGRQTDMSWGLGLLYSRVDYDSSTSDLFGVGAGVPVDAARQISVGVAAFFESTDVAAGSVPDAVRTAGVQSADYTSFDIGVMYRTTDTQQNVWRVGLVATDVGEEYGDMYWRLGGSVQMPNLLTLAVDVYDVTGEYDGHVNVGVEYPLPVDSTVVPVRAGLLDGDVTVGAGYRVDGWEAAVSYQDLDNWRELSIGISTWF